MYRNYFEDIWKLHFQWGEGILYFPLKQLNSSMLVTSPIPGEWYNFVFPTVDNQESFNLLEAENELVKNKYKPSIIILENQIKNGFDEMLIRNGYKFKGRDTWMGYDKVSYLNNKVEADVVEVLPEKFSDYDDVLGKVFADFPGNSIYNDICQKTLTGELKNTFPGLKNELFMIYETDLPVSGAAMFYSVEKNFAYLHDAGTLEKFRGKGYQSDLIKYRVNKAVNLGIDRIYSSVDHGEKSWANSIRCGLNQMHTAHIYGKD